MRRQSRSNEKDIRRCVVFNCLDFAALFRFEEVFVRRYLIQQTLRRDAKTIT